MPKTDDNPTTIGETPAELEPVIPDEAIDDLAEVRRLTLELADLEKAIQERHEARGALLVQVRDTHPGLSCGDIAAAVGVNRQRVWTLTDEARHGSRRARARNRARNLPEAG